MTPSLRWVMGRRLLLAAALLLAVATGAGL
jgi:hypothetical protein